MSSVNRWSNVRVGPGASLESLEPRQLLAATLSAKGTLVVEGTSSGDTIVISRDPKRTTKILATINGAGVKFNSASVKRIEMYGDGGGDAVTLNDSLGVISARGASLYGGDGDDTLVGGLASALFDGGNGFDSILGSSRSDEIYGGIADDTLVGGKGDDLIVGGGNNDRIFGSAGNDLLYGDGGSDTIFGEDGNDTIGGDGEDRFDFAGQAAPPSMLANDSLVGGNGDDWITGGDESATLHDQDNGKDTLTGGAGNDVLDARGWSVGSGNLDDVITDRQAGDIVPMENYTRPATPAEAAMLDDAYVVHAHAVLHLNITDGGAPKAVEIPAGVGDFVDPDVNDTGPRLHTHSGDTSVIHMHDLDPHSFTLGEFFRGWGVTISATNVGRYQAARGHTLTVTVTHGDGTTETIAHPYNYVIQGADTPAQGDQITVTYV
jgi:Ca2+-binding RTX toxin-like protein